MARSISKKISVKASTSNTSGKPPPGDAYFGIEPAIQFYEIEDGDNDEEREYA